MERIVKFEAGGGTVASIRFVLKGKEGAVQFLMLTGWVREGKCPYAPMGADVGYHSPVPYYEGQGIICDSCEYLDGAPCYYDGSSFAANNLLTRLMQEGEGAVWGELEAYYARVFGEAH